jgi:hypothetical protein
MMILPSGRVLPADQGCGSGSGAFLNPGSGIGDEQPGAYFREHRNQCFGLKYLNYLMRMRNPGWKKFGSWMENVGSGIRDKHPGSNTATNSHCRHSHHTITSNHRAGTAVASAIQIFKIAATALL